MSDRINAPVAEHPESQERGDFRERIPYSLVRLGTRLRAHGKSAADIRVRMIRILRLRPGADGWRS